MLIRATTYLLTFLLGNFVGYTLRGIIDKTCKDDFKDEIVLISVTAIFVITSIMSLVNPDVKVPTALYGLMGGIVGYLFPKKFGRKQ